MSEQKELTHEQVRAIHQQVPISLNLNLDQVNGILFALGKAPLEFAQGPSQMLTNLTTPQVQAWDAQQIAKQRAMEAANAAEAEAKQPAPPDEAV